MNNAGGTNFASFGKGILDTSVDEFDQMMDLNVKQYVEIDCRECLSAMFQSASSLKIFRSSSGEDKWSYRQCILDLSISYAQQGQRMRHKFPEIAKCFQQ